MASRRLPKNKCFNLLAIFSTLKMFLVHRFLHVLLRWEPLKVTHLWRMINRIAMMDDHGTCGTKHVLQKHIYIYCISIYIYVYIVQCIWDNYKPCFEIDIQKLPHWSRNLFAMFVTMMTTIGNLTCMSCWLCWLTHHQHRIFLSSREYLGGTAGFFATQNGGCTWTLVESAMCLKENHKIKIIFDPEPSM